MSEKIEGIVLDCIRFKENSVIAKVFTKDYGLITIIINGLGAKKTKLSLASLQPLTHIECLLYFKDNRSVNKVSDLVVINSPFGPVNNIVKNSIAVFVAELVVRTTKDLLKDQSVFVLLLEIVSVLDDEKESINSLHVYFMIKYMQVLGFTIIGDQTQEHFKTETQIEAKLVQFLNLKEFQHVVMTKNEKKIALNYLLSSLCSSLGSFEIKSFKILEEVMA